MSKIRAAAFGAVVFIGIAASAAAQAPTKADSARARQGEIRRERVEGQRRMEGRRGMRDGRTERRMRDRGMRQGGKHRGMRQGGMRGRGMRDGRMGRGAGRNFIAGLNLTEAQQTRVRAIREKYAPQYRAIREQTVTGMRDLRGPGQARDTSAAARQRMQQQREQIRTRVTAIRQQEQNEIRSVLTAEQRSKVDAVRAEHAKRLEDRAKQLQDQARQLRSR